MLKASCLTLEINEFRCYEAKIEESEKGRPAVAGSRTQDTSGLSRQCSATEPQQPDNHQPSQSSICTAQVLLNAPVTHLAATQYVPSLSHSVCAVRTPLGVDRKILSIRKEPMLSGLVSLNAQSILPHAISKLLWVW